jgi:hypothetical protein
MVGHVVMGILPKDEIEKDSNPSLLVRLSKIANNPTHHNADQAKKLRDGWRSTLTEAQLLAWRKRVKLFLEQNETSINRPF